MVERIRILLQTNQLTPTQFADSIGVARPIISHILSGRNKPSLEVVQRIIAAFPAISLPWLLSGAGDMLAAAEPVSTRVATPLVTKPTSAPAQSGSQGAPRAPQPASRSTTPKEPEVAVRRPEQDLFGSPASPQPLPNLQSSPPLVPQDQSGANAPVVSVPVAAPAAVVLVPPPAAAQSPATAAPTPSPVSPADISLASAFVEPGKSIRRIVIFYQDGTFTDYQPETNL